MPLAGKGADIAILGGRRINHQSRDSSERQGKTELDSVSIVHQFERRHYSAPPATNTAFPSSYSDHSVRAEGYARIIGRPEGTGKRRPQSARSRPAFRTDPRNKEFSSTTVLDTSTSSSGSLSVPADYLSSDNPLQPSALISQLREATRNMPTEAVWDAMLSALSDSSEIVGQKEADAASSPPKLSLPRANRVSTPAKGISRKEESASPGRGREALPAEVSVMSASTAADTSEGRLSTGQSSLAASCESRCSSQGRQRQQRLRRDCTIWLRQEQWKAQRRAAWVS